MAKVKKQPNYSRFSKNPPQRAAKNRTASPKSQIRHDGSSQRLSLVQKVILAIIGILVLIVVVLTIFALKFDTKFQVEAKLSDLAHEYYESYYYPNAFGNDTKVSTNFLSRFKETGLLPVTMRQLILTLEDIPKSDVDLLQKYCDENATSVHFFPEEPYAVDSYRAEFNYSCHFD